MTLLGQQHFALGGYYYVKFELDAALWAELSRPRPDGLGQIQFALGCIPSAFHVLHNQLMPAAWVQVLCMD